MAHIGLILAFSKGRAVDTFCFILDKIQHTSNSNAELLLYQMSISPGHIDQASSLPSYGCPFPLLLNYKYTHICLQQIKDTSS